MAHIAYQRGFLAARSSLAKAHLRRRKRCTRIFTLNSRLTMAEQPLLPQPHPRRAALRQVLRADYQQPTAPAGCHCQSLPHWQLNAKQLAPCGAVGATIVRIVPGGYDCVAS